ncbi:X8 domain containing protein [Trema orientale]|uniref:X8 domain containing protein n=1 Tax=Trema orientale TaxID=63057 RepID=A0A2P5CUG2_TREOI|nr:X8 domain containing protein [Trema orientale]
MAALVYIVVFLALTGYSSATYCVCKDGLPDQSLQKTLDYACGAGADCSPILQNGACYNPNTVKDHCSYAVNSYFQRKGQAQGSCDFSGTASQSQTPPSTTTTQNPSCVYPSSASSTTPTGTPTTTTPSTTPTTTTPSTTPTTGTTIGGTTSPTTFGGISPGSSTTFDGTGGVSALSPGSSNMFIISSSVMTLLWFCGFWLQN